MADCFLLYSKHISYVRIQNKILFCDNRFMRLRTCGVSSISQNQEFINFLLM